MPDGLNRKIIATHDGRFHADEVFAIAVLEIYLESKTEVVRTRDEDKISSADFVIDVGRKYLPKEGRFDHHQNESVGKRENGIPYASFGLVWREFGEKVCDSQGAAEKIDKKLVQAVDASDNSISLCEPQIEGAKHYSINKAVRAMNEVENKQERRDSFRKAVDVAKLILKNEFDRASRHIKEEKYCKEVYEDAENKKLLVMDRSVSVRSLRQFPEPLFSVKPGDDDVWILRTIQRNDSREPRKPLPKKWGGKRGDELVEVTGVESAKFCHNNLYFAISKNKEGALNLAELALEN